MRKLLACIIFELFLVSFVPTASAAISVNGSSGLIDTPSADVLRPEKVSIGYYRLNDGGSGAIGVNVVKRVEVGFAAQRFDEHSRNADLLNLKYNVVPESVLLPGIAAGVEDIAACRQRTVYAVASKTLPFGFRVHAGAGNGRFKGFFGAVEKRINPVSALSGNNTFPATTIILEYDGHHANYAARMSIVPGLKLDAGLYDHKFYFGMSFVN